MKQNKIIVLVDADPLVRTKMMARLIVNKKFAITVSDAVKLIKDTPYEFDLHNAYFIFAVNYKLDSSPITTQKLFELACRGLMIAIGTSRIPKHFEHFCEVYYQENLL